VILTCPTCRQLSRHPPNKMLGRWAICPHCGGEIDWRELSSIGDFLCTPPKPIATPNDPKEKKR
jgi:hypothetical protein